MKIKILSIAIIFVMICNIYITSASITSTNNLNDTSNDDVIEIRVALYTDENESDPVFYGPYKRTCYFIYALRNYSWIAGDTTYRIKIDLLNSNELISGKLSRDNYDVLLYPPDQVYQRSLLIRTLEKINIKSFIESGGGYYGTCAGGIVAGKMQNRPETMFERSWKKCMLGISDIEYQIKAAYPLYNQLLGRSPERLHPEYAYYFYSGWNQTNPIINYHSGLCVDAPIDTGHPIFDGYLSDTRRIRIIGGYSMVIPETSNREIEVLASFPSEEISDNTSTQIHYWKYTGGIQGIIKSLFNGDSLYYNVFGGARQNIMIYGGDWEKTDEIVQTNTSNKPMMATEIYNNENKGRLVMTTAHPEHNVWWGGYIEEVDHEYNNLYEGLYHWNGIINEIDAIQDEFTYSHEFTYNYWIIRRSIAWASQKVPDNDLPPVYGPSQVRKFEENMTTSNFIVFGNLETAEGNISLDLYYRYSQDKINWGNWTFYETDTDESDGWSWDFDSPDGTGYYEFYSIRQVEHQGNIETENPPPEADTAVFAEAD